MKRTYKRITITIIIMICVLLLAACKYVHIKTYKASDEVSPTASNSQISDNKTDNEKNPGKTDDKKASGNTNTASMPQPTQIQPVANTKLNIFTVTDQGELAPVTVMVPEGKTITPELIVQNVVASLADNSIDIAVESKGVTVKDDAVIVSFTSEKPPYKNLGAGPESAILDAIAQSLTDNLKEYTKVIFRVEGKAYKSDHFEFGIDEPYLK